MYPDYQPVVDQHDTWLTLNPVQGCPTTCSYCSLHTLGLTSTRPTELATPAEAVRQLLTHRYYAPHLVLALYTSTDALATPETRAHLTGLLKALSAAQIPNPVCLVTKFPLTDDVAAAIDRARNQGLTVLVYVSYSGLGPDHEPGIDPGALRGTFRRLHAESIPTLHYLRPALPANSDPALLSQLLDHVAPFAQCTVVVGTKVKPAARDQITRLWPELADPHLSPETADSVWPRSTWTWLHHLPDRFTGHPVFQTNSCALAYVLRRADRAGVLGTPTCAGNQCPNRQRERCRQSDPGRPAVTDSAIRAHLDRLGHPELSFAYRHQTRTVVLARPAPLRDRHNLAQVLGVTVRAADDPGESLWPGRLSGAQPLVIDPT
ncbi:hypothetical protein ACWEPR_21015 [Streptomyces sp. NPDC004290]|uniref:hypothetical protein n=1 Tax=unclassified Streptomyces TaxID=2593676 RepID=UPI0036859BF7